MKKLTALFLALVMLLGATSAMATQANAIATIGGADGPTTITVAAATTAIEIPTVHTNVKIIDINEATLLGLLSSSVPADVSQEELKMVEEMITSLCKLMEAYGLDLTVQNNGLFYAISLADAPLISFDVAVEEGNLRIASSLFPSYVIQVPVQEALTRIGEIVAELMQESFADFSINGRTFKTPDELLAFALEVLATIPQESIQTIEMDLQNTIMGMLTISENSTFTKDGEAYPNQMTFALTKGDCYALVDTFMRNLPKATFDIFGENVYAQMQNDWAEVTAKKATFETEALLSMNLYATDGEKMYCELKVADLPALYASIQMEDGKKLIINVTDESAQFTLDGVIQENATFVDFQSKLIKYTIDVALEGTTLKGSVAYDLMGITTGVVFEGTQTSPTDSQITLHQSIMGKEFAVMEIVTEATEPRTIALEGKTMLTVDVNAPIEATLEQFMVMQEDVQTSLINMMGLLMQQAPEFFQMIASANSVAITVTDTVENTVVDTVETTVAE